MRADPLLMESFACEMDAAVYHSSLVGTTTFQQRAVTHQMLRVAASHTLATCVRARRTAELRKDAKAQAEATAKLAQHQALSGHGKRNDHQDPLLHDASRNSAIASAVEATRPKRR